MNMNRIEEQNLDDICIRRRVFSIELSNGQLAQVADVRVTVNPISGEVCAIAPFFTKPHMIWPSEEKAYREAIYRAGLFAGPWEQKQKEQKTK